MTFRTEWLAAVERKDSLLCAGIDPAESGLHRGREGLPTGADFQSWVAEYIEAIAPFCSAVKPNLQYFRDQPAALELVSQMARYHGMVVVHDGKFADISSTNDAAMYYSAKQGAHAVTVAPFAGNMKEAAVQARKHKVGMFSLCLMSNPEYGVEKDKLVRIDDLLAPADLSCVITETGIYRKDIITLRKTKESRHYLPQYLHLAYCAAKYDVEGLVVGAPSAKKGGNHITIEELRRIKSYCTDDMLILSPGVGKQGGDPAQLIAIFGNNVLVNVGRDMMYPKGRDCAAIARYYCNLLNGHRKSLIPAS